MGIIMRNNIAYSGGGGSETVELSMAEYEAREAAGAIDSDTWYLIYDANDSYNAKKIVYDNAESGMEASTVQGAIDELNSNFENYLSIVESINSRLVYIEENLGTLTTEQYTCSGTFSKSTSNYNSISQNVIFDKAYIEIPTVQVSFTSNPDSKFTNLTVSNITKLGCTITASYGGSGSRTCTIKWVASGLVQKQL